VAIVGAGSIGFRHFQSLLSMRERLQIDLVDPSLEARARCETEFGSFARNSRLSTFAKVDDVEHPADAVIVATDSRSRRAVVERFLDKGSRAFLLEKVLFTRLEDYDAVGAALHRVKARAWVNCPRRSYPGAPKVRDAVRGKTIHYSVIGSGWGMGCNLVHYLDEFSWLTGVHDVALSIGGLEAGTVQAKRPGYIEFLGTITGTAGPHRFEAACGRDGSGKASVSIRAADLKMTICGHQIVTTVDGNVAGAEPYPIPHQSESTAVHLKAIMDGLSPDLPGYDESADLHRLVIAALLRHMQLSANDPTIQECLVT
jgi:predicted dehydrogenase